MEKNQEMLGTLSDNLVEIGKGLFRASSLIGILPCADDRIFVIIKHGNILDKVEVLGINYNDFKEELEAANRAHNHTYIPEHTLLPESGSYPPMPACKPSRVEEAVEATYPPTPLPIISGTPQPIRPPATVIPLPIRVIGVEILIDNLSLLSASGHLPIAEDESIVERSNLIISDRNGSILGQGHRDGMGTIVGESVSGIINCNGTYRLVFKEYGDTKAFVSYNILTK